MSISEQEALRILMKSRDRISAAAWVVVRDAHAAEDIFQSVAVKAMTKDVAFDSDGAVLSWALITARHAAIDWLRRHRRESSAPSTNVLALLEEDWLTQAARDDERTEALRECLDGLPTQSRELLRLRYSDGLPCAKISERMGTQLNALYKRLSRLHQALGDCVEMRLTKAPESMT